MSTIDDNTAEPGGGSAQSEHRTGPEIDLGRRRFAWLTLGTAATATLISPSALAGGGKGGKKGGKIECGGSWNHSAMHSMMQGKKWTCKGLSHTYWRKSANFDNWPTQFRRNDKFHRVCSIAPAFNQNLIHVLRKRATPIRPSHWDPFLHEIDNSALNSYDNALRNCGRAMVANMLNAAKFDPNYAMTPSEVEYDFRDAWVVPVAPASLDECKTQIIQCTHVLNSTRSKFESHYG